MLLRSTQPEPTCRSGIAPKRGSSAEFKLGIHEAVPVAISPEPIIRGIRADGFYIWREGYTHGTTQ